MMKKEDIFATALELIAKQGLHDAPMAQIAAEANVAAGTIYHYFSGKNEMIRELYISIRDEVKSQTTAEETDMKNYETEFSSLCLRIFKFLIQNPLKFRFLQQYEHSPLGKNAESDIVDVEFPVGEDFFRLGAENDLLKPMPLSLISNLTYNSMAAMAELHLAGKIELNRDLIQTVIDGCWNMVRK
jgi:TetR/AcrR family transcriptional regulator, multidrug resistance operon repressor